jgi:hypothetical protein
MEEVSIREYARRRGKSHVKVLRDIKAGLILKTASGKIDPEAADAAWELNRSPSRSSKPLPGKETGPLPKGKPVGPTLSTQGKRSYADAREKREYVHLERDAMGLKKLRGSMVSVEEVDARARSVANIVREGMLSIPDRVSSLIAAETDASRVHGILSAEIRRALIALADQVASM